MWRFVSELLKDPEKVRAGMNRLIEKELSERGGDPRREAEAWTKKIAESDRLRSAYQDQQAAALMTLDKLGSKLKELDRVRELARAELGRLQRRRERVEDLEQDRDAVSRILGGDVARDPGSLVGRGEEEALRDDLAGGRGSS